MIQYNTKNAEIDIKNWRVPKGDSPIDALKFWILISCHSFPYDSIIRRPLYIIQVQGRKESKKQFIQERALPNRLYILQDYLMHASDVPKYTEADNDLVMTLNSLRFATHEYTQKTVFCNEFNVI